MAIGMLRDDLLSLPGVESAEFDGDPVRPTGIRVGLSRGVDPAGVGAEVHRVLAQHGLRPDDPSSPTRSTPLFAEAPDRAVSASSPETEIHQAVVVGASTDGVLLPGTGLESVSVSEGRDGIVVTAVGGATSASVRAASSSTPAIDQAVVAAVAELVATGTVPLVVSVDERRLGGTTVVTVVLEESGARRVGSAVVEAGRSYALGRAVWAGLASR